MTGYQYGPADSTHLGEFAFLIEKPPEPGTNLRMERYSLQTIEKDGKAIGYIMLFGDKQSSAEDPTAENNFLTTTQVLLDMHFANSTERAYVTIEEVVRLRGAVNAMAWYHNGIGFLAWASSQTAIAAYTQELILAQHIQPEFTSLAQMEGSVLPSKFTTLAGCTWASLSLSATRPQEMLKYGNDWRTSRYPLARHFAMRDFYCGTGTTEGGTMSIVEMQDEFMHHRFFTWFLDNYGLSEKAKEIEVDGLKTVIYKDGSLRWFKDQFFYQLTSDTIYDQSSPKGRAALTEDHLIRLANQIITAKN